jgi:hypothetical protein
MSTCISIDIMMIVIAVIVVTNTIALIILARSHLKLKFNYQVLTEFMQNLNNDITELYTFAQSIDDYKSITDQQMNHLYKKITETKSTPQVNSQINTPSNESSNHPYNLVIQQVRNGANVNDLMQNSGLSQDEAALLIRLHGRKD